jgi:hypothetical protein
MRGRRVHHEETLGRCDKGAAGREIGPSLSIVPERRNHDKLSIRAEWQRWKFRESQLEDAGRAITVLFIYNAWVEES